MKIPTALFCLFVLALAVDAHAQQWDTAGQLALQHRNKTDFGGSDRWYSVAAIDGSVGHYWTPHIKLELDVGTTGQGEIAGAEPAAASGLPFPFSRYREHKLRETTIGGTAMYQFFENQWVHPFVGAESSWCTNGTWLIRFPQQTSRFQRRRFGCRPLPRLMRRTIQCGRSSRADSSST